MCGMHWMEKGEEFGRVRDTRRRGSRFSLKSLGANDDNPLATVINTLFFSVAAIIGSGSQLRVLTKNFCIVTKLQRTYFVSTRSFLPRHYP